MNENEVAVILLGYQSDYFDTSDTLHGAFEDTKTVEAVRRNTLKLLRTLSGTKMVDGLVRAA